MTDAEMEEYLKMLDRARSQLPEKVFQDVRFEPPKADSIIEGNRTFIRNFREIVHALNRDPNHLLKFFTLELGTAGTIEGNRAIFQGKHSRHFINQLLERYIKNYVICSECGKPDTQLITRDRIMMLRCEACGAVSAVPQMK